jgi:hypothetical protein
MNVETIGLVFVVWLLGGIAFCALWAFAHRLDDRLTAATKRVDQLTLQQQ